MFGENIYKKFCKFNLVRHLLRGATLGPFGLREMIRYLTTPNDIKLKSSMLFGTTLLCIPNRLGHGYGIH